MFNKLFLLFVFGALQFSAKAQDLYPIDSCGFHISDTLDQGCGKWANGFIWTYSDCEIHDFRVLVSDRYGRVVYYDNDIHKTYETYKMRQDGFRDTQTFYWRVTGFVIVEGVKRVINWQGTIHYWN